MTLRYPPSVPLATVGVYATNVHSQIAIAGKNSCNAVKRGQTNVVAAFAARIREMVNAPDGPLAGFIPPGAALVPTPRSAKVVRGGLWPALVFCEALENAGLAAKTRLLLDRHTPVTKSHLQARGARNDVADHTSSIGFVGGLWPPESIVLIDDVVTRGCTLYGCAAILHTQFLGIQVRALAAFRTRGFIDDLDEWYDPWLGELRRVGASGVVRRPD